MHVFVRQLGEAAHETARMLQFEGREMYELQEHPGRRSIAVAELSLSEERMRVESALRESCHEEHRR